jgi:hypothetical protein
MRGPIKQPGMAALRAAGAGDHCWAVEAAQRPAAVQPGRARLVADAGGQGWDPAVFGSVSRLAAGAAGAAAAVGLPDRRRRSGALPGARRPALARISAAVLPVVWLVHAAGVTTRQDSMTFEVTLPEGRHVAGTPEGEHTTGTATALAAYPFHSRAHSIARLAHNLRSSPRPRDGAAMAPLSASFRRSLAP